ncbi:MAG: hypothetical protein JO321_14070 [Solirubrobacterales bacterium]|nr:hypothetical protein [Solirubrobacterales bacterium]MBV9536529.1 hypothetical protein [Solirubrobacterales bacterium]
MVDRAYTDADLDAAVAALSEPGRLQAAEDLVTRVAPALRRVLDEAIGQGGWFDQGHDQAIREATAVDDPRVRAEAVSTLIAQETQLGMFVGVTVGFELARELGTLRGEGRRGSSSGDEAEQKEE